MAHEGRRVESQTLWDQLQAVAGHLEPTYDALGRQALATSVIHVVETRWSRLGADAPAAGTVWNIATPTIAFYRILPGKSTEEGRQRRSPSTAMRCTNASRATARASDWRIVGRTRNANMRVSAQCLACRAASVRPSPYPTPSSRPQRHRQNLNCTDMIVRSRPRALKNNDHLDG